jgi:hypothetical protein
MLDEDDDFVGKLVFSDEATFHIDDKVNCHKCRIWDTENTHVVVEEERDSPNSTCFVPSPCRSCMGHFSSQRPPSQVTRISKC